ncbi:MAG TPA: HAMP domain-containing sensor histidine kinase [Planctomycetota bacterium]|nr:HAMP domain-containing sensor histidine kinase [Planctomycetota bacterium]
MRSLDLHIPSRRQRWRESIHEFLHVLRDPFTYAPRKNPEVVFGFLWGLPIPVFAIGIHLHAAGLNCDLNVCLAILRSNPGYIVFLLHPFLFAMLFGALGTMRAHREAHIRKLLEDEIHRTEELCEANTRLQELDKMKSEFIANVTHELKSPLVTALGYTDRILGRHLGEINERQQKGLEVGKRNLIRLRKLIDEILDFSKLDAGVAKFESQPVNFSETIESVMENLALKTKDRGMAVQIELADPAARVLGDAGKLYQVVLNLLENAIKFSADGSTITLRLLQDGSKWHLIVQDQGCGIPADVLPRLFQRFYQVNASLNRTHDGVGLGLVIVSKIVEAHSGRIWIESEPGVGTRVHVELPVLQETANTKEATYATATPG